MNLLVFSTRIKNVFEKKTIFVLLKYCEKKVFYSRESDIRTQRDFRRLKIHFENVSSKNGRFWM